MGLDDRLEFDSSNHGICTTAAAPTLLEPRARLYTQKLDFKKHGNGIHPPKICFLIKCVS
jgi:hypothetical protein